jgi:hypothetical protein
MTALTLLENNVLLCHPIASTMAIQLDSALPPNK